MWSGRSRSDGAARPWRPTPLLTGSVALHAAGLAVAALAPKQRRRVAALLVADHLVLLASGLSPRSRALGPNLLRLPDSSESEGAVGLTFDDGPDPEATPAVLDLLERHGARASFFCIGRKVERWPELAREIVRRGHRVENHTHSHPWSFSLRGLRGMAAEIDRAQEVIERVTGRAPRLFRPPAGFKNPMLEPVLARRGLWLTSWSRRGFDTVWSDARAIRRRLTPGLGAGEILLLHDGCAARDRRGRPVVLEVLPGLLESMAEAGLRAAPVDPPPVD